MACLDAGKDITVPGGVKVFFTETGGTERDLGNIVGDSVSIARDTEELEHFTNRSGQRRKDKVITVEESAQIDFELDEINVENLRYFFKGGAISTVGAGTTAVTLQKETLVGEEFISVEQPGLTAVSVRQFVDNVFLDDNGTFIDHSVEADTAGGTPFEINNAAADQFYIGKKTQFKEIEIDTNVASVGYAGGAWEYWNGSAWVALDTLSDGTSNFTVTGAQLVTHVPQTNWTQNAVNGVTQYWIRYNQTADPPTTPATIDSVGIQAMVEHTDYDVDPGAAASSTSTRNGAVRRIAAGSLVDGEEVYVNYTYVTFTSQTFGIAETSTLEGSARFEAYPGTGRGRKWNMIIPKCQLVNNGTMDLDDTDFETIPLSLVVLDNYDCDTTNPFGTVTVFPHA
jgi:hypothetical protein